MTVYILGGSRTAFGTFMGSLSEVPAPKLGAVAINGALKNAQVEKDQVGEVFMGHVVQAGCGQAPARQATLFADLPDSVPASTINKVCGSGLQAIVAGARTIMTGDQGIVVSGGMENMSLAPHVLPTSRTGFKFGNLEMRDSMQWDGLWDVYSNRPMGNCAEECVKKYHMTREEQDAFAMESFKRAQKSINDGIFKSEISPVMIAGKKGSVEVSQDEGPFKANFEKMPTLRPAFEKEGSITAANASTINDGAAAVVLGNEAYKHLAKFKIVGFASHAQHPTWFSTAPVGAMQKVLSKTGLKIEQMDLFEINEAFAAVTMAAMKEFKLPHDRVNIFGGAVAIGHPIGASGARIVVTLMNALERTQGKYGMASICIGGGEAIAMIIERIKA